MTYQQASDMFSQWEQTYETTGHVNIAQHEWQAVIAVLAKGE